MPPIRLLQCKSDGEIIFREPTTSDVPAYAILSHTWGKEEVSFQDMEAGEGMSKAGWKKIQFCAKQAAADGLKYFWVDTCCIDKKNAVELSAAINSMFRWYHKATRCYVYLSDVLIHGEGQNGHTNPIWEAAFTKSRWFTRGWTLQELIAPEYIDFFSSEGERLGNKLSLEALIHSVTGIARNALRNEPLTTFSIDERMSWAERRNTTLEEDKAYCLLGIFDISMSLIYGEGGEKAVRRLRHEIHISYKGTDYNQFSVGIDLSTLPQSVQFVARSNELAEMHRILYNRSTRSMVVLHGLGGIGKTQLALTYTMRHEEKYTAILWLNANDEDSLKLSFRAVAQQILRYHPSISVLNGVDLDDLNQVVYMVKAWLDLQKNAHWLIIYDNYDNPRIRGNTDSSAVDIRQFLPVSNHGSIIITTRSAQVSQGHRRKDIVEEPAATELVKELDGLPLALSTAGAYLEHVTTSFSEYLQLYRASWLKLQQTSPHLSSYGEDRSLFSTWQITFDRIKQQNAKSAKLLKLWAYFDRQDVWFELLRHSNSSDEEWLRELTEDKLSFNEAVRLLQDYGLVDADLSFQQLSDSGGYSVHSCMHSWMVFVLNKEWDKKLARVALSCVASMVPGTHIDSWWLLQRRLLQHATRQAQLIEGVGLDVKDLEWALDRFGYLYANQGKLAEAEAMYTRALQGTEEALGSKHTLTLGTVNNLGLLYVDQGKLAEAEAMYTRALQGYEEAFGPEHISLRLPALSTIFAFGDLFSRTDRKDLAKVMYSQALSGYTAIQGPSSKWCRQLEDRLQALQSESAKLKAGQDQSTEIRAPKSRSLKQKLYKLERRFKVG
ncbi:MAG: hypothetical protein Q9160_009258 [Pyrenula sp. 1 TL-2023]